MNYLCFALFCKQASNAQLPNIIVKEYASSLIDPDREECYNIAVSEARQRGIAVCVPPDLGIDYCLACGHNHGNRWGGHGDPVRDYACHDCKCVDPVWAYERGAPLIYIG